MTGIRSNAEQLAARYRRRAQQLPGAVTRGLLRVLTLVNAKQIENLSGSSSAPPGAYPVPIRNPQSGLRQSANWRQLSPTVGIVLNTARKGGFNYAVAVHEGRGSSAKYGARPFLDDAARAVDAAQVMAVEVRGALQ